MTVVVYKSFRNSIKNKERILTINIIKSKNTGELSKIYSVRLYRMVKVFLSITDRRHKSSGLFKITFVFN